MGKIGWSLPGTKSTKARKRLKNVCAMLQKDFGGGPLNFNWSIHVGHQTTSLDLNITPDKFASDPQLYRMCAVCVVLAMGKELVAATAGD